MNRRPGEDIVVTDIDSFIKKHEEEKAKGQKSKRSKKPKKPVSPFKFNRKTVITFSVVILVLLFIASGVLLIFKIVNSGGEDPGNVLSSDEIRKREEYYTELEKKKLTFFLEDMAVCCYEQDGYFENNQLVDILEQECYYINRKGEKQFGKSFYYAYPFYSYGLAVVVEKNQIGNTLCGVINTNGEYVVKPRFTSICPYFDDKGTTLVSKNGKYGVINTKGELVVELKYNKIGEFNEYGRALASTDFSYVFIDRNGNEIQIPEEYVFTDFDSHDGFYPICNQKSGLHGFLSTKTCEIGISCIYVSTGSFQNGYGIVQTSKGKSWIDKNGKLVTDSFFKNVEPFNEYGYAIATNDGGEAPYIVSTSGEVLDLTSKFITSVQYIGENRYAGVLNDKYCIFKPDGDIITAPMFDMVTEYGNGVILCKYKNEYYVVDIDGEILFCKPDKSLSQIYRFQNSFGLIMLSDVVEDKYMYINESGENAFNESYVRAYPFTNDGYAVVIRKDENGRRFHRIIDKEGNIVFDADEMRITFNTSIITGKW